MAYHPFLLHDQTMSVFFFWSCWPVFPSVLTPFGLTHCESCLITISQHNNNYRYKILQKCRHGYKNWLIRYLSWIADMTAVRKDHPGNTMLLGHIDKQQLFPFQWTAIWSSHMMANRVYFKTQKLAIHRSLTHFPQIASTLIIELLILNNMQVAMLKGMSRQQIMRLFTPRLWCKNDGDKGNVEYDAQNEKNLYLSNKILITMT